MLEMEEAMIKRWSTWEELLLGAAVLRHTTQNWEVVAAELRSRTPYPFYFTPEVCKARYEDLKQRYSGCRTWFDELRKQRMEELREALVQSDDSIGSLKAKLKSLKADKESDHHNVEYSSSQTISLPLTQFHRSDDVEATSKDLSWDELSAGSFTHDNILTNHESQIPQTTVSPQEPETKMEISESKVSSDGNLANNVYLGGKLGGTLRKKRGRRRKKDCITKIEKGSIEDVDVANVSRCKENSRNNLCLNAGSCSVNQKTGLSTNKLQDPMEIFCCILENKCASIFSRRLDGQKRSRYRKLILRHMDLETIRSRIENNTITSVRELFRDLLLIANNALVFYSKNTQVYKSAFLLRDLVNKAMQQHLGENSSSKTATVPFLFGPFMVKPRSSRPSNTSKEGKKPCIADLATPLQQEVIVKKGHMRQIKNEQKNSGRRAEISTPSKRRKKT